MSQKLFGAVEKGDLDTIRSELAGGVDVDVKNKHGKSALLIAVEHGVLI